MILIKKLEIKDKYTDNQKKAKPNSTQSSRSQSFKCLLQPECQPLTQRVPSWHPHYISNVHLKLSTNSEPNSSHCPPKCMGFQSYPLGQGSSVDTPCRAVLDVSLCLISTSDSSEILWACPQNRTRIQLLSTPAPSTAVLTAALDLVLPCPLCMAGSLQCLPEARCHPPLQTAMAGRVHAGLQPPWRSCFLSCCPSPPLCSSHTGLLDVPASGSSHLSRGCSVPW